MDEMRCAVDSEARQGQEELLVGPVRRPTNDKQTISAANSMISHKSCAKYQFKGPWDVAGRAVKQQIRSIDARNRRLSDLSGTNL
jgi:hypothetical protein